jgi:hypothetical protein
MIYRIATCILIVLTFITILYMPTTTALSALQHLYMLHIMKTIHIVVSCYIDNDWNICKVREIHINNVLIILFRFMIMIV